MVLLALGEVWWEAAEQSNRMCVHVCANGVSGQERADSWLALDGVALVLARAGEITENESVFDDGEESTDVRPFIPNLASLGAGATTAAACEACEAGYYSGTAGWRR